MVIGLYVDDINGFYHPEDRAEYFEFGRVDKGSLQAEGSGRPQSILGMRVEIR